MEGAFAASAIDLAIDTVLSPPIFFYPNAVVVAYMFSFVATPVTGTLAQVIAPRLPAGQGIYRCGTAIDPAFAIAPFVLAANETRVALLKDEIASAFAGLACIRPPRSEAAGWPQSAYHAACSSPFRR
jgi:hypothetical protein